MCSGNRIAHVWFCKNNAQQIKKIWNFHGERVVMDKKITSNADR